jgi:hypothetical protein
MTNIYFCFYGFVLGLETKTAETRQRYGDKVDREGIV